MKRKRTVLLLSAALFILIPATVIAAKTLIKPTAVAGGYYSDIVNRVEFTADHTAFTFQKTSEEETSYQATITLSLKKCEADFYGRIDNIDVSGIHYETLTFLCQTPGLENTLPQGLHLPTQDGESVPLTYKILLTFSADAAGTYTPTLDIAYTSGLTEATADERLLQIPLMITIE